jgi:hypothetical protein
MLKADEEPALLALLEANWQAEMEDHATYKALASGELDPFERSVKQLCGSTECPLESGPTTARRLRAQGLWDFRSLRSAG